MLEQKLLAEEMADEHVDLSLDTWAKQLSETVGKELLSSIIKKVYLDAIEDTLTNIEECIDKYKAYPTSELKTELRKCFYVPGY